MVASVASRLQHRGLDVTVEISNEDAYDESLLELNRQAVTSSIDAELDTEERWRTYISPTSSTAALAAFMGVRRVYRRLRLAPPWRTRIEADDAGPRMLRRLINIELSHLHLMARAVDLNSDWALIVEDDAGVDDAEAFSDALAEFLWRQDASQQPLFVNVSRSFTESRLRIDAHLRDVGEWRDGTGTRILSAERPVTNTVCAILYRTAFLRSLLDTLNGIPLSPVLPIDWKLNEAILRLVANDRLGEGDCWFLAPGPVVQRSML